MSPIALVDEIIMCDSCDSIIVQGANILVDNKGCIKLADFGASKQVEKLVSRHIKYIWYLLSQLFCTGLLFIVKPS
jgi:hypothetical protein